MTNFIPGHIVKTVQTKKDNIAVIRYPKWEDIDEYVRYWNEISKEDTFILMSGEELTKEDEIEYFSDKFKGMEMEHKVLLTCFIDNSLVGTVTIERIGKKDRIRHMAILGLTVAESVRGEHIGYELLNTAITEAIRHIADLKILIADVFNQNDIAKNLYYNVGFKDAGVTPKALFYKDEYVDELRMYLEINPEAFPHEETKQTLENMPSESQE